MLRDHLQIYTLSIVFIGDFNPVITQPFWLANKKLIREQEAQNADIEVIHKEVSKFTLDWLTIEVTRDRFELKTSQEPYFEPMKDLAISIFKSLNETPLRGVGINHLKYFALNDENSYFNFGNKLAPLSNWSDFTNDPKMMNLDIIEQKRKDGLAGHYRIRVQPSDLKLATNFAILININDHFGIAKTSNDNSGEIIKTLAENWGASSKRAENIIEAIWEKVNT